MAATESVSTIFIALRASLARAVMGIVPPKEIEDIVQETYVRVCQIERKGTINAPKSYLFRTARNLALDFIKRSETGSTESYEENSDADYDVDQWPSDETFDQVSSHEEFALFCDAVRHLPVQCRRAFVLKKVYGYSQRDIANEMNVSESTVEKHIALGIKRCTYFLQKIKDSKHGEERHNTSTKLRRQASSQKGRRS